MNYKTVHPFSFSLIHCHLLDNLRWDPIHRSSLALLLLWTFTFLYFIRDVCVCSPALYPPRHRILHLFFDHYSDSFLAVLISCFCITLLPCYDLFYSHPLLMYPWRLNCCMLSVWHWLYDTVKENCIFFFSKWYVFHVFPSISLWSLFLFSLNCVPI